MLVELVLTTLLAAGAAPAGCLDDAAAPLRQRLLAEINADRAAAGLHGLRFSPVLCRVAQERAGTLAAAGSPSSSWEVLARVSRRLFGLGYRAHRWSEQALMGDDNPFAGWRAAAGEGYRDTALGDFLHLGIGVTAADDLTLQTFVFALPKREHELRQAAPLSDLAAVRRAVMARVNAARRAHRRQPLATEPLLDRAAQAHAEDMLRRSYYDHLSPEGMNVRSRAVAAGYKAQRLGENIAKGLFAPEEVVERWLASSGHRRNLLSRGFQHLGVGLAVGETERGVEVIWVQVFGAPR